MRAPRGVYKAAENAWFVCAMANRYPGMKYTSSEPPSFPHAHRLSADHVFRNLEKSYNFEHDFKRRPVTPVPKYLLLPQPGNDGSAILRPKHNPSSNEPEEDIRIVQHLSFNTIPWETIDEFNKERKLFEAFRLKYAGQLKTLQDWKRWERFKASAAASHSGVRRSKSGRPVRHSSSSAGRMLGSSGVCGTGRTGVEPTDLPPKRSPRRASRPRAGFQKRQADW
jgi:hypothetical protein